VLSEQEMKVVIPNVFVINSQSVSKIHINMNLDIRILKERQ